MDFTLNSTQMMIRKQIRHFAQDYLKPLAPYLDKQDGEIVNHPKLIETIARMNLFGIQIDEKYGGAALDAISYCIIIEEISKACASTGLMTTVHNSVAAIPLEKFGSEDQKRSKCRQNSSAGPRNPQ